MPPAGPTLILVDGLPGVGKSIVAHLLCWHMRRHGISARWYWELESPHPIFDFAEAIDGDRLRDGFLEDAEARWRRFAADLSQRAETTIVESSFLQSAVHPMVALDWPESRIAAYLGAVEEALQPARPILLLLRYRDVRAGFNESARIRGDWFPSLLASKLEVTPYARARQLKGTEGVVEYLRAYQALTDTLVRELRMTSVSVDADTGERAALERIAEVLGLPPFVPPTTDVPDLDAYIGVYRRPDTEDCCRILSDGEHLYIEGTPNARLLQIDEFRFEIAGTCVLYVFLRASDGGRMDALECHGNFPQLAPMWVRGE